MAKNKMKVGLVFGGKSTEYAVSLRSARNIIEALDQDKYTFTLFGFSEEGQLMSQQYANHLLDNPLVLAESDESKENIEHLSLSYMIDDSTVKSQDIDVFFSIMHGNLGEDGSIQGFFRMLDKPFVGSSVLSSALCMDKDFTKQILNYHGFQTAPSITIHRSDEIDLEQLYQQVTDLLGDIVFIKPVNQGSSVGISKSSDRQSFENGVRNAFLYDTKVLIESFVAGKELECAVLGNHYPEASRVGGIVAKTDFYSYESKYLDEKGAVLEIPANISEEVERQVQLMSKNAFKLLECRGLARVDFFYTPEGKIILNEVNTLPGFTNISMYAKLWEISGMPYGDLIERLISLAVEEYNENKQIKRSVNK